MQPTTMYDKIWRAHLVREAAGEPSLIYIDRHLIHEVTSAQAFAGLEAAGPQGAPPRPHLCGDGPLRPHEEPRLPIVDRMTRACKSRRSPACKRHGIPFVRHGQPQSGHRAHHRSRARHHAAGLTIVCGDSHTSTHGAFGALAFGIGTSEVEHVLATQCLQQSAPRPCTWSSRQTPQRRLLQRPGPRADRKDRHLGGTDHVIEYAGEAIRGLSMEARMTICNMTIEGGARAGMVAPDDTTFAYLEGRPFVPTRAKHFRKRSSAGKQLPSDPGAQFDATVELDATQIAPQVTWGTNPGMVTSVTGTRARSHSFADPDAQKAAARALEYMALTAGTGHGGYSRGPRLHRLLHQRAPRGSARRRPRGARQARGEARSRRR
jgi:3-isopropylmalate/(R)-2-methylmalate dehydratase large subunit